MHSKSILAGTALMFGRSVMILGPKGSGTYQAASQALDFVGGPTITLSMTDINQQAIQAFKEGCLAVQSRTLVKIDNLIKKMPNAILCIHGMEKMKVHWVCYFLQQWIEGRKIMMVGEYCEYLPLIDRFEVVRM